MGKTVEQAKIMDHTIVADCSSFNTRLQQLTPVGFTFVTKHVVLSHLDQRWRQTFELFNSGL